MPEHPDSFDVPRRADDAEARSSEPRGPWPQADAPGHPGQGPISSPLPTERDPAAVTSSIAGQQEAQALRATLREKERTIAELNGQCRRLEDQVEDLCRDLDALRMGAERTVQVRPEADPRPRTPLHRARNAASPAGRRAPAANAPVRPPATSGPRRKPDPGRGQMPALVVGLTAGMLLATAAAAGLWWTGWWPPPRGAGPLATPGAQPAGAQGTAASAPEGPADPAAGIAEDPPVAGEVRDAGGPDMIVLRPGAFTMGNAFGMSDSDARPARQISLDAFLIGAREVSVDEYDRYVRATGTRRPDDFGRGRDRPVVDVSWDDAVAYTRWLSRQTGKPYRLPSEAEWEYAARAGSDSMYWWGFDDPQGRAVCFDCGSPFDRRGPAPVGYSGPNAFGLYDTAGNAYEWVADCYVPSYSGAPDDGSPVEQAGCRQRVARGGSYKSPMASIRVYARRAFEPDTRVDAIGFRVARDAD